MLPHNYCSYELQRFEANLWCFLYYYYSLHTEGLLNRIMINKEIIQNQEWDESCAIEIQIDILNNSDWLYRAVTTRDFEFSSPKERGIDDNHLKEIKDQTAINQRHVKVEK